MKKSLLLIALVGILNKSVYSQILFNDDFTGQTTTGQGFGPPNTSLYETLESDGRTTTDSAITSNKSWMYINYSDIGMGYYSNSFWANNLSSSAANDFLIMKSPINLAGKISPYLKFDYFTTGDSCIIEVKVVTSIAGSTPVISDFNSAATLWTSSFIAGTNGVFTPVGKIDLSAYSGNVYIAFVNKTLARRRVGIRFSQVKAKIPNDAEMVTNTMDTLNETIDWDITSIKQYKLLAYNDTSHTINITITNDGSSVINSLIVTHDITPGPTLSDTLTGLSIAPGTSYTYTHSKLAKFVGATDGFYTFRTWVNLSGDTIPINDTIEKFVIVQNSFPISASNPFKLGFEGPDGGASLDFINTLKCRFRRVNFNATDTLKLIAPNVFTGAIKAQAVSNGDASAAVFPVSINGTPTPTTTRQHIMFPPITFENGKKYVVKYMANTIGDSALIRFLTSTNNTQTTATMTVSASTQVRIGTPVENPLPFSQSLTITGTGVPTYLTFEYRGVWYFFIDDVEISEMVAPVANFTVITDASGNIDYDSIVSFTNTSVAEGATYSWNFGDAAGLGTKNTSTLKDPIPVKYPKPGKYTITLTVTNGAGSNTKTIEIEVKELPAPVANFTTTITGLKVKFVNTSTPDISSPASIATTYSWDFGDASPLSTVKSPADKTYTKGGKYNICLTAKNKVGENTKCSEVTLAGVGIASVDFVQVQIFPNPVRDGKLYIQNDMNTVLSYKVTDMRGKVVSADKLVSNKDGQIDLTNVPNGIYFIELDSKGDKMIKKIVVDKQ